MERKGSFPSMPLLSPRRPLSGSHRAVQPPVSLPAFGPPPSEPPGEEATPTAAVAPREGSGSGSSLFEAALFPGLAEQEDDGAQSADWRTSRLARAVGERKRLWVGLAGVWVVLVVVLQFGAVAAALVTAGVGLAAAKALGLAWKVDAESAGEAVQLAMSGLNSVTAFVYNVVYLVEVEKTMIVVAVATVFAYIRFL